MNAALAGESPPHPVFIHDIPPEFVFAKARLTPAVTRGSQDLHA